MNYKSCFKCYWASQCGTDYPCEHYTPISDTEDEDMLYNEMESQRDDYRAAWFDYIEEFYN